MHYTRLPGRQRFDANKTQHPDKVVEYVKSLEKAFLADPPEGDSRSRWDFLRDTIHTNALRAFEKKQ